jgi:hypothetical protein
MCTILFSYQFLPSDSCFPTETRQDVAQATKSCGNRMAADCYQKPARPAAARRANRSRTDLLLRPSRRQHVAPPQGRSPVATLAAFESIGPEVRSRRPQVGHSINLTPNRRQMREEFGKGSSWTYSRHLRENECVNNSQSPVCLSLECCNLMRLKTVRLSNEYLSLLSTFARLRDHSILSHMNAHIRSAALTAKRSPEWAKE